MKYLNDIIKSLYEDNEIKRFIIDNKLSKEEIANNLYALTTQLDNNKIIANSKNNYLDDPEGMASRLEYNNGIVDLIYYEVIPSGSRNNLERLFFPLKEDIEKMEIYKTPGRTKALKQTMKFANNYEKGKQIKGVYLHGLFGCGKSFIMQKLAISLSNKGAKVILAYYPDLVRTIKSSIGSRNTEIIINKLKNVDILILDDIGAETNTNFIRDEVLGPILQYRVDSHLPVCMTSNLSLEELQTHFGDSNTNENIINSERIISRIRSLMIEVKLDDENYRDKK